MSIVDALRQAMGEKTEEEFAAELGIPQPTLNRILNRKRNIGFDVARKMRASIKGRYPEIDRELAGFLLGGDIPLGMVDTVKVSEPTCWREGGKRGRRRA